MASIIASRNGRRWEGVQLVERGGGETKVTDDNGMEKATCASDGPDEQTFDPREAVRVYFQCVQNFAEDF